MCNAPRAFYHEQVIAVPAIIQGTLRIKAIHLKDMLKGQEPPFAEKGKGTMDIRKILKVSEKIGVEWIIVEQDRCSWPSLESAQISMDYLKRV